MSISKDNLEAAQAQDFALLLGLVPDVVSDSTQASPKHRRKHERGSTWVARTVVCVFGGDGWNDKEWKGRDEKCCVSWLDLGIQYGNEVEDSKVEERDGTMTVT